MRWQQLTYRVPDAAQRAAPLRRGALLIRDPASGTMGPGSAEQRKECCAASGTRELPHHPLAADPEARLQHLLVDLADAGHRKVLDELDVFWRVGRAFLRFHEVDQFILAGPRALA